MRVTVGAHFSSAKSEVRTELGTRAVLDCPVIGDKPITVEWYRNNKLLAPALVTGLKVAN